MTFENAIIFLVCVFIVTVGIAVYNFFSGRKYDSAESNMLGARAVFCAVFELLVIMFLVFVVSPAFDKLEEKEENYQAMLTEIEENAESISFYLDGVEVEYDHIDIAQYDVSYDEENGKVFLTKKESKSGSSFVPFFFWIR